MMAQRFAIVHQRMLRHEIFRKKTITYRSSQPEKLLLQHTITPIESLLGKSNSDYARVVVLGILVQVEESIFYLEDPTGRVNVSFDGAKAVDDFYVTENSILLVEGIFQHEVLSVDRVGSPFVEQRQKSLQILQHQVRHTHYLPVSRPTRRATSFAVLSDVHLDQPRVLNLLQCLFEEYGSYTKPSELPVFCLMGNFSSSTSHPLNQAWEELALLIAKFPFLSRHAHFVFIPGPNDSRSRVLPAAPLVCETSGLERTMQSYQIDHVYWGSNPCRIRHLGKEIVFFRYDTLSCMLQSQVRLLPTDAMVHRTPHSRMVRTVIDQGHLLPLSRAPISWNYDHTMRLYPLPDALILGGSSSAEEYESYEECDAIHPGSFAKTGTYSIYSPFCASDGDVSVEDAGGAIRPGSSVQFCQVKKQNVD